MAKFNKNTNLKRYVLFVASLASFVAVPAMAAILVQNFMTYDLVVDEPPIRKDQGADADYDGDGDDTTGYLQVDLGQTISNEDSANPAVGTDTLLSNEQITFTCFSGDRVYYTDVIQLVNTDTGTGENNDWDVNLRIEPQLDSGGTGDQLTQGGLADSDENADVWVYVSEVDTTTTAVASRPNPNAGALADWYDTATATATDTAAIVPLQVEIINGTASVLTQETTKFPIPEGEQRQIALVADCSPEMASGDTISFNITVEATPASQNALDF